MIKMRKSKKNIIGWNLGRLWAVLLFALLLGGCGAANYGKLVWDSETQKAFEANQVPEKYRYYYYGFDTRPYVVFGIEPRYEMNSRMWRQVTPNTAEFNEMIRWIWEDYGYRIFGADILNPQGEKVGILYSSIHETMVKFGDGNRIEVIPHTPFLWGPEADNGSGVRAH